MHKLSQSQTRKAVNATKLPLTFYDIMEKF